MGLARAKADTCKDGNRAISVVGDSQQEMSGCVKMAPLGVAQSKLGGVERSHVRSLALRCD